jgi:hypothetical protein
MGVVKGVAYIVGYLEQVGLKGTHLEIAQTPYYQQNCHAEEETGHQVPRVGHGGDQRHRPHLPVVGQGRRTQQEPPVESRQVAERQDSARLRTSQQVSVIKRSISKCGIGVFRQIR